MDKKYKVLLFLSSLFIIAIIASAIEKGEDSYYCEPGETLVVVNQGVFSDRWECVPVSSFEGDKMYIYIDHSQKKEVEWNITDSDANEYTFTIIKDSDVIPIGGIIQ